VMIHDGQPRHFANGRKVGGFDCRDRGV
jgi:hypothetical protein